MRLNSSLLILLLTPVSLAAQTSAETAAQRQLREDRERFNREVDRHATEAKSRDAQARAAESEQRTREQVERLRSQQSAQAAETQAIRQRVNEQSTVIAPSITRTSETTLPAASVTPDFSVTFLADGNCVIYVKGRLPEIKSPSETEKTLQALLKSRTKSSAPDTPPKP
jgi:phage-related minor tail protein